MKKIRLAKCVDRDSTVLKYIQNVMLNMSLFHSNSTIYALPNSIQLFFESKNERTIFIKRSDLYLIQKEPAYFAFRAHRYACEFQASISHTMLLVLTLTIFFSYDTNAYSRYWKHCTHEFWFTRVWVCALVTKTVIVGIE